MWLGILCREKIMYAAASQEGINIFNRPRETNEIDLVSLVRNMLINSGKSNEVINAFDNHHFINTVKDKNAEVQRQYLNRYWHLQLVSVSANSSNERFCLVPNGSISDWIRLFEAKILPFIIEHDLPKAIKI